MRILIYDEDKVQVPHIIDVLRQYNNDVVQVTDWKELRKIIKEFVPEGIVIDLMIPAVGLPSDQCSGGYTTGVYIYKTIIHDIAKGVPFIAYSGVELGVNFIQKGIDELKMFEEYKGVLQKGCEENNIVTLLRSSHVRS